MWLTSTGHATDETHNITYNITIAYKLELEHKLTHTFKKAIP